MLENVKVKGQVELVLRDKDGNIITREQPNLIVNTGLALVTSRLIGTASGVISHMAVGTTNTAAAATQTDLLAIAGSRKAITSANQVTTTVTNDTVQYIATFIAGEGTGALVEAGLFNAA